MEDEITHIARHFEEIAAQLEAPEYGPITQDWNGSTYALRPPRQLHSSAHWWSSSSTPGSPAPGYGARELGAMTRAFEHAVNGITHRLFLLEQRLGERGALGEGPLAPPAVPVRAASFDDPSVGEGAMDRGPAAPSGTGELLVSLKSGLAGLREEVRNIASGFERLESDARIAEARFSAIEECTVALHAVEARLDAADANGPDGLAELAMLERIEHNLGARLREIEELVSSSAQAITASVGDPAATGQAMADHFAALEGLVAARTESVRREISEHVEHELAGHLAALEGLIAASTQSLADAAPERSTLERLEIEVTTRLSDLELVAATRAQAIESRSERAEAETAARFSALEELVSATARSTELTLSRSFDDKLGHRLGALEGLVTASTQSLADLAADRRTLEGLRDEVTTRFSALEALVAARFSALEERISESARSLAAAMRDPGALESLRGEVATRFSALEGLVAASTQSLAATMVEPDALGRLESGLRAALDTMSARLDNERVSASNDELRAEFGVLRDSIEMLILRIDNLSNTGRGPNPTLAAGESEMPLSTLEEKLDVAASTLARVGAYLARLEERYENIEVSKLFSSESETPDLPRADEFAGIDEFARGIDELTRVEPEPDETEVGLDEEAESTPPGPPGDLDGLPFDSSEAPVYQERRRLFRRIPY